MADEPQGWRIQPHAGIIGTSTFTPVGRGPLETFEQRRDLIQQVFFRRNHLAAVLRIDPGGWRPGWKQGDYSWGHGSNPSQRQHGGMGVRTVGLLRSDGLLS